MAKALLKSQPNPLIPHPSRGPLELLFAIPLSSTMPNLESTAAEQHGHPSPSSAAHMTKPCNLAGEPGKGSPSNAHGFKAFQLKLHCTPGNPFPR